MKRKDFQLIGLDDEFLSLMDDTGETRDDLKCPEDAVGDEIRNAIEKDMDILVSLENVYWGEIVSAGSTVVWAHKWILSVRNIPDILLLGF